MSHFKTHENQAHLHCKYCDEKFTNNARRAIHIRQIQTKIPLIKCEPCDKGFYTRISFRTHINQMHSKKSYKCLVYSNEIREFEGEQE